MAARPPGAATVSWSTSRLRTGFGNSVTTRSGPIRASTCDNRRMLWRAEMNERQLAITVSIGASARPIMMDAAIMAPAVISP